MPDFRRLISAGLLATALAAPLLAAPPDGVRAQMLQARALQLRGGGEDPAAAAAIYRRVAAQVPGSAEVQLRLSEALQEAQDLKGALAPARRAVELAPASVEARAHLGLLLYQLTQGDAAMAPEAVRELGVATTLLPQDPELWARLAEVSEQLKDGPAALRAWLRLGRLRPGFLPSWEHALIHARAAQTYEARREAVLALCARNPEERHLRLLEELAREQIEAGYLAHAEESFLLLARRLPKEAGLWENVSLIRLQTHRFDEALESLAKAEDLQRTPRTAFNVARALMNLGRFQEAEARLAEVLAGKVEPDWIADGAQALYAEALLLQGKGNLLLAYFKAHPPRAGVAGELQVFTCQALISRNDWKQALAALKQGIATYPKVPFFQQAATLPPQSFEYRFLSRKGTRIALEQLHLEGMAAIWAEFRRWDKCLEAIEKARELGPVKGVDTLIMLSSAYEQVGRGEDSLRILREAQRLEPNNSLVQNNLGYSLLEQGKHLEEAAALIEASAKASPENGSVMDSLGWAQYRLGKLDAAEATLRKAVALNPYSWEVRQHLGEVLEQQGKLGEAAEQWERALAFVFPDRQALEKRLGELRIRLAKEQAQKAEGDRKAPANPAEPTPDDEPEDFQ